MATFSAFVLKPLAPFHIGSEGVGLEGTSDMIHSDTLFSALCHAWMQSGEELPGENWPVRLSSVFPLVAKPGGNPGSIPLSAAHPDEALYLFPKPLIEIADWPGETPGKQPPAEEPQSPLASKTLKNARWISRSLLEKLRRGHPLPEITLAGGEEIILTPAEKAAFFPLDELPWKSGLEAVRPRVAVDRMQSLSQLYHVGQVYFAERTALYFLAEGPAEKLDKILPALEILGDCGLGGERTYGYGLFRCLGSHSLSFEEIGNSPHLLLSLFHPRSVEEVKQALAPPARYRLTERKGFMDSPEGRNYRRQCLLMVGEGSILSARPDGAIADVRPAATRELVGHPVYRNGRAFSLPGRYSVEEKP